eukprot:CAMPEP_0206530514 /NCGR_PEP_ID=MMETSP0325_2-20121206/3222_1 /ASSEMBLY_ACC=CAM_ASM_000347 /TAXON_ID=2866 /ORGANISM="Crypthecodinium cohnii, Strain Seligo" /LENGTH=165 /DNA_ID=CAMNT_0054026595 /DNA_START=459 /DNA_END=957 /DNA_ORIENTATION=-
MVQTDVKFSCSLAACCLLGEELAVGGRGLVGLLGVSEEVEHCRPHLRTRDRVVASEVILEMSDGVCGQATFVRGSHLEVGGSGLQKLEGCQSPCSLVSGKGGALGGAARASAARASAARGSTARASAESDLCQLLLGMKIIGHCISAAEPKPKHLPRRRGKKLGK